MEKILFLLIFYVFIYSTFSNTKSEIVDKYINMMESDQIKIDTVQYLDNEMVYNYHSNKRGMRLEIKNDSNVTIYDDIYDENNKYFIAEVYYFNNYAAIDYKSICDDFNNKVLIYDFNSDKVIDTIKNVFSVQVLDSNCYYRTRTDSFFSIFHCKHSETAVPKRLIN
jgi:hypothetical protein